MHNFRDVILGEEHRLRPGATFSGYRTGLRHSGSDATPRGTPMTRGPSPVAMLKVMLDVAAFAAMKVWERSKKAPATLRSNLPSSLPRFWSLFGFIFKKKFRDQNWDPITGEMELEYQKARKKYRTKPARLWLFLCFFARTLCLIFECAVRSGAAKVYAGLFVWWAEKAMKAIYWLVEWWQNRRD